jgi:c(7)-type cytochrome triheme protein
MRLTMVAFALAASCLAGAGEWQSLANDGIHDPKGPGIKIKQEPRDALSKLTPDSTGNQVRWVQALDKGEINPISNLYPNTQVLILDLDILLDLKGSMPIVRFPHRQHTLWLHCANCHDELFGQKKLFEMTTGDTKISMLRILEGEQCGLCHGAVSFPLTECKRCHSVPRTSAPVTGAPPPVPPAH